MRFFLFLLFPFILFSCKQERVNRMATYYNVGDTLSVDGPCIVINPYPKSEEEAKAFQVDTLKAVTRLADRFRSIFTSDSIAVIVSKQSVIKFTDFFNEFPSQSVDLKNEGAEIVFFWPGRDPYTSKSMNVKEELSIQVLSALGRIDTSKEDYQKELIRLAKEDSIMQKENTKAKENVVQKEDSITNTISNPTQSLSISPKK